MLPTKILRSAFTVLLVCIIALNSFTSPAFAYNGSSAVDSFVNGFWSALGGIFGAATGTVITCWTVDAIIAPVNPPMAAYLAGTCAAVGATVGGVGGVAGANSLTKAH